MDKLFFNIDNVENIELKTDSSTKTKFYFGDLETLRGKKIVSIDIPDVANVTTSPLGNALVNATVFKKSHLVLSVDGKEKVNRIPVGILNPYNNNAKRVYFNSLQVNWPKSYIDVVTTANISTSEVFYLVVYFAD